jgi:uncharacterized FAD-dependent dehydrogenase
MATIYDIGIVGAGVSGIFAAHRILEKQKKIKTILFDIGRPPMKRRLQMFGFGGLLPNSDGKLYLSDTKKVADIVGDTKSKKAYDWVLSVLDFIEPTTIINDDGPNKSLSKKLKSAEYHIIKNSYIPMFSSHIHGLLKYFAIEFDNTIDFCFDQEIVSVRKSKGIFILSTDAGEYKCRQVLLATGRSGWRWAANIFNQFDIIEDNSIARYGIKIEMSADVLQDLDRSSCSLHNDRVNIGPIHWNGTVIPEDRWKTDKVSFDFIGNIECENGFEETDRVGKLTFLLANDRIARERVSSIVAGKSKTLSILPEYDWIKKDLKKFGEVIPDIITKAYFHAPALLPLPPIISLGTNLSTDIDGLFVAGENAGVVGLLAAAEMGMIAADGIIRSI